MASMWKGLLQRGKTTGSAEDLKPSDAPDTSSGDASASLDLAVDSVKSKPFIAGPSEEHKEIEISDDVRAEPEAADTSFPPDANSVNESKEVLAEVQAVMETMMLTAAASAKPMQADDVEGLKEQLVQLGEAQREMKRMVFPSSRQVTFASEASYPSTDDLPCNVAVGST